MPSWRAERTRRCRVFISTARAARYGTGSSYGPAGVKLLLLTSEEHLPMLTFVQHDCEGGRSSVICVRKELFDDAQAEGVVSDHVPDSACELLLLLEVHSERHLCRALTQMKRSTTVLPTGCRQIADDNARKDEDECDDPMTRQLELPRQKLCPRPCKGLARASGGVGDHGTQCRHDPCRVVNAGRVNISTKGGASSVPALFAWYCTADRIKTGQAWPSSNIAFQ